MSTDVRSPGDSARRLLSFREDWEPLCRFLDVAARIPDGRDACQRRYGTFSDEAVLAGLAESMSRIHQLGAALGRPPLADHGKTAPGSGSQAGQTVYARLVSAAGSVAAAAHALGEAGSRLEVLLAPAAPVSERSARVRWGLSGAEGLAAGARAAAHEVEDVRRALADAVTRFLAVMTAFQQTQAVNQANVAIGALESRIARLRVEAAGARDKAGKWLGRAAAEKKLHALEKAIADAEADLARKRALVEDTSTFFSTGNAVAPALGKAQEKLRSLAKVFEDAAALVTTLSKVSSAEQLTDHRWLVRALEASPAWQPWADLERAAREVASGATGKLGTAATEDA